MSVTLASGAVLAAIGLCSGSYAGTAALRWCRKQQSSFGRSSCDHCGVQLGFARTVPILSYASLLGTCASCGESIDRTHLFAEVAGGVVLVVAFAAAGPVEAVLLSALGLVLVAEAVCDAKTKRLPDVLTLAIAVLCAALSVLRSPQALLVGAVSAAATFVCLEGLRRLYAKWRGRPGLGFGDVKLLTALALLDGPQTPWVVVIAACVGLGFAAIWRLGRERMAFGPHIAIAAWVVALIIEAGRWPTWA